MLSCPRCPVVKCVRHRGDDVCCSVVLCVMWSDLPKTSAIGCPLWSSVYECQRVECAVSMRVAAMLVWGPGEVWLQ